MAKHSVKKVRARSSRQKRPKPALFVLLAVIVLVLIFAVLRFADCSGKGNIAEGEEITVTVEQGMNSRQIGDLLEESRVIASSATFTRKVKMRGDAESLKPGTYVFVGGEDLEQIIDALVDGAQGVTLLIPEGYRIKDIAAKLEEKCGVSAQKFITESKNVTTYSSDFPFLKDAYQGSLEGYLFPDTYTIDLNASISDIIKMMLKNTESKLQSVDMSYAQSKNLTVADVVTLASIIEKESRNDSDKADISEVFYNRLKNGINLGSDVTTYYAVDKELSEELTKSDLASKNPFNTRNPNNKGLPPGPICSPGLQAIEAAAHPNTGDYFYFFYSQSQDKTMFYKDETSFNEAWEKYGK